VTVLAEDYMEVFTNGIPIAGWFIYNGKTHEKKHENWGYPHDFNLHNAI